MILIWGVLDMKTLFIQKCLASNQICLARAAAEGNPGSVTWAFHTYVLKIERCVQCSPYPIPLTRALKRR